MAEEFSTTPIAVGGMAEPRFREQLGEAQVLPTAKPYVPDLSGITKVGKKEKGDLLEEPTLPTGLHPPMRRFLKREINEFYDKVVEEYPERRKEPGFKNEIEEFVEIIMGTAADSKKESLELSKLNTQIQSKGLSKFENANNWSEINSDEFLKQFKGDPISAQVALEQKRQGMALKRQALDLVKDVGLSKRIKLETDKTVVSSTDPKTGQITTTLTRELTEEEGQKTAEDLLQFAPRFEQAQFEYNALSADKQEQYIDGINSPIVNYYKETYVRPGIKTEGETRIKGGRKAPSEREGYQYSTKNYNYTKNTIKATETPSTFIGEVLKKLIPDEIPEIIITRNDKAELNFLKFEHPTKQGELVGLQPYSFRELRNGWYLYGTEKESGDEIYIEYDKIKAKFSSKFEGANIDKILGKKEAKEKTDLRKKYNY